jgi:hypothetical protein
MKILACFNGGSGDGMRCKMHEDDNNEAF